MQGLAVADRPKNLLLLNVGDARFVIDKMTTGKLANWSGRMLRLFIARIRYIAAAMMVAAFQLWQELDIAMPVTCCKTAKSCGWIN